MTRDSLFEFQFLLILKYEHPIQYTEVEVQHYLESETKPCTPKVSYVYSAGVRPGHSKARLGSYGYSVPVSAGGSSSQEAADRAVALRLQQEDAMLMSSSQRGSGSSALPPLQSRNPYQPNAPPSWMPPSIPPAGPYPQYVSSKGLNS